MARTRPQIEVAAILLHLVISMTIAIASPHALDAQSDPEPLIGRWDLTVIDSSTTYPSWLEIRNSGYETLVGSYVGRFGSARPISQIEVGADGYRFVVPKQWEQRTDDLVHRFVLQGDTLVGETTDDTGARITWKGVRAPTLERRTRIDWQPEWGPAIELFNGRDLEGWTTQLERAANGWIVRDGLLINEKPGNNLLTELTFDDFQLRAEFRYPKGSNSGLYLRGRYEVQIEDDFGLEADSHRIGGIYGHLTPSSNAARQHGEWQTFEITLIGRRVTVMFNGERIIDRQVIPGITGGALDSREAEPGPILIQGDHGPVEFRKLTLTPAKNLPGD